MRWMLVCQALLLLTCPGVAQKEYGFDNRKSSGQPYLSPAETVKRMKVMPGFSVKLFAAEPLMTNPIAMTVDEKGRVWIIESFEYPKRTPKGQAPRDRIVILEDTDGDGVADKRTVFADGADFPVPQERAAKGLGAFDMASGLEVGHGGCFVGAAPYLWHLKDTKGTGKADTFEIVASGFGSQDTHETLNTFTWGPDGWLYGLHGIFTVSKVKPGVAEQPDGVDLDAGIWRYHPRTKKFEVFAEGTSNPWGMDFNSQGECFICCCVIPHLFHITPGGIYIKQGSKPSHHQYAYGALKEICDHTFHKESGWAHAGLLCLDAAHLPAELRSSVIFGSIHGCSIKRNVLKPNGSTFIGNRADDFLVSGDKNFRPIQLRWAPDGSILVSDWHDQNPCHQTKPDDWDYERGRIYRIVPDKIEPPVKEADMPFQLRTKARLAMENPPRKSERQHFFTIGGYSIGGGDTMAPLPEGDYRRNIAELQSAILNKCPEAMLTALKSQYEPIRIAALRAITDGLVIKNNSQLKPLLEMARREKSPRVLAELLGYLIRRQGDMNHLPVLEEILKKQQLQNDRTIPFLLWLAVEREMRGRSDDIMMVLVKYSSQNEMLIKHIIPRAARRLAAGGQVADVAKAVRFITMLPDDATQIAALSGMAEALQGRKQTAPSGWTETAAALRTKKNPEMDRLLQKVSASLNDPAASRAALQAARDPQRTTEDRQEALRQLAVSQPAQTLEVCLGIVNANSEALTLRLEAARTLASVEENRVAGDILDQWKNYPQPLRAELVNTLRSRKPWAKELLLALGNKTVLRADLNDNIALAIRQFKDQELNVLLDKHYGVFRDSPAEIESLLKKLRVEVPQVAGDAVRGKAVFTKHCAQCHQFAGQGHEVGPQLDGAERSMEYLLVNVIDPNRVVGTPYFSRTIVLMNGKLLTGLLVEEDATTLRLKRENAVIEVVVKADIEEQATSTKSLMPEGLSSNMTVQDLRDLIRYLEPAPKK